MIALLAKDVADLPPHLLERAVAEWARTSRFMPKAAELIELASSYLAKPKAEEDLNKAAAKLNAGMMARPDGRRDIHWIVEDGQLRLEFARAPEPRVYRPLTFTEEQINAYAKKQQASKKRAA